MTWGGEAILGMHNWWHGVAKVKATTSKTQAPLRVGVLGTAAINYAALYDPVASHPDAVVTALASRSEEKLKAHIAQYKLDSRIMQYAGYEELLEDRDVDAVYIPLPNSLHHEWAIKSMKAGKHVLVEKPMASNFGQVDDIRKVSESTGMIALEALHWRLHPAAHTVRSLCERYGSIQSISVRMALPDGALKEGDIRFRYDLAGGACMDLNYVFSACCYFASSNVDSCEFEVLEARAKINEADKQIDETMNATFLIKDHGKAPVKCMIEADHKRPMKFMLGFIPDIMDIVPPLTIELEGARIEFPNFPGPWVLCRITVTEKDSSGQLTAKKHRVTSYEGGPEWKDKGARFWTTYRYQLEAFVDAIRAREAGRSYEGPWVTLEESAKLQQLIDAVYRAAGMAPRGM